jgi:hypothetical protein
MPAKITMATIPVITLPLPHCLFQGSSGFLMGSGSGYVMLDSKRELEGGSNSTPEGLTSLPPKLPPNSLGLTTNSIRTRPQPIDGWGQLAQCYHHLYAGWMRAWGQRGYPSGIGQLRTLRFVPHPLRSHRELTIWLFDPVRPLIPNSLGDRASNHDRCMTGTAQHADGTISEQRPRGHRAGDR